MNNQTAVNPSLRLRVFMLLNEHKHPSLFGRWFNRFIMLLIVLNVLAIIAESVNPWYQAYKTAFTVFELFSVVVFTLEYGLRLWSCVENPKLKETGNPRRSYFLSPIALIDLLAILPFYLQFFMVLDLRFIRIVRILRVFKLTRYSSAFKLLFNVFIKEKEALTAAFSIMFVLLILSSAGIYLIEHDIQPEQFGSIPAAMWWAMATLTTVGYGDVTPVTAAGKFFGGFITFLGMGMVALPTGIMVNGFSEQLRLRRQRFTAMVKEALEDGVVTDKEWDNLDKISEELGFNEEEARLLMKINGANQQLKDKVCPHCNKKIH